MKYPNLVLILAILIASASSISAQNLALAGISGEAYKVPFTSNFSGAVREAMGISVSKRPIPYFQKDLQTRLDALVPAWLKDAGAKDLVQWDADAADEDARMANLELNDDVSYLAAVEAENGLRIGGRKKERINDLQIQLRDRTNQYADELDRDYLIFVRVVATHEVLKKKLDKPLKGGKKLNGVAFIVVTILDAADASVVASKVKTVNGADTQLKINLSSKALANKCEGVVKRTFNKFLNKIER